MYGRALGECCSHVGAVLFALETSIRMQNEATVTDVPAYWMYPSAAKFDKPYKRLLEMDFQGAAKKRKTEQEQEKVTISIMDNIPSSTKREEAAFFQKLHSVIPKAAILSLTDKFSHHFKPTSASMQWPQEYAKLFDRSMSCSSLDTITERCEELSSEMSVSEEQVSFVFLESQTREQARSTQWFAQRTGSYSFNFPCSLPCKNQ